MDSIDKIYILVHPTYEKVRHERLLQHFQALGIPSEKCKFNASTWGSELTAHQIFEVWDPFLRPGLPTFTWKSRFLSKGEISLVLNFYVAAVHAIQNGYKKILIFESDIWLAPDFLQRFHALMEDLKEKEWDFVSLGEGVGTRPQGAPMSYWSPTKAYTPPHQWVFRCTDSMLFQVSFLEKVVQTLIPFRECLDWELNFQIGLHQGKALWADPPLAEQGSSRNREDSLLPA